MNRHAKELQRHNNIDDYDYLFKCLLLGDSSVGKSSIVERYVENDYKPHFISTIGVDFKIKTIEYESKVLKLQIWDTAGQERFRSIIHGYYRGATGIVLVYDLLNPDSALSIANMWLHEIERNAPLGTPIVLVGNKLDLVTDATRNIAKTTRSHVSTILECHPDIQHIECSAKDGVRIDDVFYNLVKPMMDTKKEEYLKGDLNPRRKLNLHSKQVSANEEYSCCTIS